MWRCRSICWRSSNLSAASARARCWQPWGSLPLANRRARDLSGGEVQRVAIARALMHRPRLVLADEPTGNLDPRSAAQTLALLRTQVKANAGAGILITHSRTAADTADRILVLDAGGLHPWTRKFTSGARAAFAIWRILLLAQLREQPARLLHYRTRDRAGRGPRRRGVSWSIPPRSTSSVWPPSAWWARPIS